MNSMVGDGSCDAPMRPWNIPAVAQFVALHAGEIPEFLPLLKEALEASIIAQEKVGLLKDLVEAFYKREKEARRLLKETDKNNTVQNENDNLESTGELKTDQVPKKKKRSKSTSENPQSGQSQSAEGSELLSDSIIINTFVGPDSGNASETPSTFSDASSKTPKKKKKKHSALTPERVVANVDGDVKVQSVSVLDQRCQTPLIRVIPSSRLMKNPVSPDPSVGNLLTHEGGSDTKNRVCFEFDSKGDLISRDGLASALKELELTDFDIISVEHANGIATLKVEFTSKKFYRVFFTKQLIVNGFVAKIKTCGTLDEMKEERAEKGLTQNEHSGSQAPSNESAVQVAPSARPWDSSQTIVKDETLPPVPLQNFDDVVKRLNEFDKRASRKEWWTQVCRARSDNRRRPSPGEEKINKCFSELKSPGHRRNRRDYRYERRVKKTDRREK